jgi:hypothetical protein
MEEASTMFLQKMVKIRASRLDRVVLRVTANKVGLRAYRTINRLTALSLGMALPVEEHLPESIERNDDIESIVS